MKKPTMQQKKVSHIEKSVKFGYNVLANELNTINGNIAVVDSTIKKIRENIKKKQKELEEKQKETEELQNDLKEALLRSKELCVKKKEASTIVNMVKNLHDQNFEEEVVDVVEVEEQEEEEKEEEEKEEEEEEQSEIEKEEQSELEEEEQSELEEEEQSEIEEEEQSEIEEQKSKADETPQTQKRKTVETPPTIKKARLTDAVNYCIEARKQQGSFSIYGVSKQFEVPRTTLRREYQKAVERVGSLMNNSDENNPFDEMLKTEKVDMRSLRQKIIKLDVEDNGGTPITVSVKYKGLSTTDLINQLGISQKNRLWDRFYKPKE